MTLGANYNLINDVVGTNFTLVSGVAVKILEANTKRIGFSVQLSCGLLPECVWIKMEDDADNSFVGENLSKDFTANDNLSNLRFELFAPNRYTGEVWAITNTIVGAVIYVNEYS